MLKKFQQSVKNSIQQDLATNKSSLILAICIPILILQTSPDEIIEWVFWWAALVLLMLTIIYLVYGIYLKYWRKD
jgi:hypothetical protein